MKKAAQALGVLDQFFIGLMVAIFALIVLHAPLTVWLGTVFPDASVLIKAWKELLMIPAGFLLLAIVWRKRRWDTLKNPFVLLAALYVAVHLALIPLFYTNAAAVLAGLAIDLRYIVYFVLALVLVQLYPEFRRFFLTVFLAGALLVGSFAMLQVFFLPVDFLTVLGYGDQTIQPYLTVDQNPEYIRISSTLRGPNPLGAYAVVTLALAFAYLWRRRPQLTWKVSSVFALLSVGALIALWYSYSRSALVAAVAAVAIVFVLTIGRRMPRWLWVAAFVVGFATLGGLYAARDTSFVQNVILHDNPSTGPAETSNDGHLESLIDGTDRKLRQPLGAGIGSTGSASLYTDEPVIIENQYLFIAHESGWAGVVIFLTLFLMILHRLWKHRHDWLALGVLASGVGLALIGLLLPVWVDDTVSIIWWGLAGLAIGGTYVRTVNKTSKRTA